jgi:glycerol-3-phosphate cytidylyltransferase
MGRVIVALTTDDEVKLRKGYEPELTYEQRKEVLEAIRYVDEVVPCKCLLDDAFLDEHQIDLLVHGHDNSNDVPPERLALLPRTVGINGWLLRARVLEAVSRVMKRDNAE